MVGAAGAAGAAGVAGTCSRAEQDSCHRNLRFNSSSLGIVRLHCGWRQETLTKMQPQLAQAAIDTESLIKKVKALSSSPVLTAESHARLSFK